MVKLISKHMGQHQMVSAIKIHQWLYNDLSIEIHGGILNKHMPHKMLVIGPGSSNLSRPVNLRRKIKGNTESRLSRQNMSYMLRRNCVLFFSYDQFMIQNAPNCSHFLSLNIQGVH